MKTLLSTIIGGSIASLSLAAYAGDVYVPGTADPWLAGQPDGTTASIEDSAPAESPAYAGTVTPGGTVTWTATGLEANGPGYTEVGPDGDINNLNGFGLIDHTTGAENGISDILNIPVDSLIGVFLGPGVPSGSAPAPLDFSGDLSYGTLTPLVDQVFYMGDGSANSVTVPTGATRLYLGPMDGYGWDNNPGSFEVDFTEGVTAPVPDGGSTLAMLGGALSLIGFARRKTK
jgi:hypothetical protein